MHCHIRLLCSQFPPKSFLSFVLSISKAARDINMAASQPQLKSVYALSKPLFLPSPNKLYA